MKILNYLTEPQKYKNSTQQQAKHGAFVKYRTFAGLIKIDSKLINLLQMNIQTSWRIIGMTIGFPLLILVSISTGWAQEPLLKTVNIPTSSTPSLRSDGLLTSHWDQGYPYNQLCPRDPMNGNSYSNAGCPAIAMGQIINYLRTTQNTRFSDNDDYVHNYAGRNYNIDDDWVTLQFPSFPKLNELLDSVDATFQRNEELPDLLSAALVFACGTACSQVYTSQGSGTFAVDQAYAAYQRFGFTDCQLFREPDSMMYATLIANLQAGYPAHLAVENPAGTVGHNVVVDNYRELDGKFHINFGYGGSLDDWYDIPDSNFFYGMTKLEGIIVNIIPSPTAVQEYSRQQPLEVYPNPVSDVLYVKNLPCEKVDYSIFNVLGQQVGAGSTSGTISVTELGNGLYFLQIKGKNFQETAKFIVK